MRYTAKAQVVNSVSEWLRAEHDYQFEKNSNTLQRNPIRSRANILTYEIPNKWAKYQKFRDLALVDKKRYPNQRLDEKLLMQIGQNLLKCAAAARAAYVWSGVVQGVDFLEASEKSLQGVESYSAGILRDGLILPKVELLGGSVEEAIKTYNIDPLAYANPNKTLIALTGLAISGVLEYQSDVSRVILPEPGHPSGELQRWAIPSSGPRTR